MVVLLVAAEVVQVEAVRPLATAVAEEMTQFPALARVVLAAMARRG